MSDVVARLLTWANCGFGHAGQRDERQIDEAEAATEITALRAELDNVEKAMGANAVRFMDPPDGGDPTLAEMVGNMRRQLDASEAELAAAKERAEAFKLTVASLKNQLTAESVRAGRLEAVSRAAEAKAEGLAKALEPFANCIFNDNGDVTVTFRSFTADELTTAYFARKQFFAAYRTDKEPGHE